MKPLSAQTPPSKIRLTVPHRLQSGGLLLLMASLTTTPVFAVTFPVFSPQAPLSLTLVAPGRVATDAQSRIFITDPLAGRVVVADALGRQVFSKTNLGQPLGIAVDAAGRIYVGDAQTGAVTVFDAQWNALRQLGAGAGEFQLPAHIATRTEDGVATVFVSDSLAHAVKVYRDGGKIGQYGSLGPGPQQFNFPTGIWLAPDGTVFVVDQQNDRMQVLDRDGNFLRWFTLRPDITQFGPSGQAQGVTGDGQGRLYVADSFQGLVKVFDLSGQFMGRMGRYGENPGEFRSPGGIVADPQGRLWVANANNARVEGFCFVRPTVNPSVLAATDGSTVRFTADPGCGGSFSYQWLKDSAPLADGGVVGGATSATLSLAGITAEEGGSYSVQVVNASGMITSDPAVLTVILRPVITSPPTEQTAPVGTTVTLSATASGSPPLFYQWSQNGVALLGQTESSLTLSNVTSAANGVYAIQVTNSVGSASASARFAVAETPAVSVDASPTGGLVLTWNHPFYVLQSAPAAEGPWQTVSLTSPFIVPASVLAQTHAQYFRLYRP